MAVGGKTRFSRKLRFIELRSRENRVFSPDCHLKWLKRIAHTNFLIRCIRPPQFETHFPALHICSQSPCPRQCPLHYAVPPHHPTQFATGICPPHCIDAVRLFCAPPTAHYAAPTPIAAIRHWYLPTPLHPCSHLIRAPPTAQYTASTISLLVYAHPTAYMQSVWNADSALCIMQRPTPSDPKCY